jgi:hypothetical protein
MMPFQSAVAPALGLFVLSKQANHNIEVIVAGIDETEEGQATKKRRSGGHVKGLLQKGSNGKHASAPGHEDC